MKKRTLITSILLGLATVAVVGYSIVGCSSVQQLGKRQPADDSNERAASPDEGREPTPQWRVVGQPSTEQVPTKIEPQAEDESHLREQVDVALKQHDPT
ncbi:MAG: hypothetical protein ACYTEK_13470, partial [Planctomycetota bacterium]